jgi:ABC-type Fe3+/spermidine/putrescine transport system ATPase subunit
VQAILELRSVSKQFPSHRAVDQLSLSVPAGGFFALLGPSGCGKTTTLRLIAGFEHPTQGEIYLDGKRVENIPPYRRDVSTVFQSYALFPHLTVRGNVEFGLRRRGVSGVAVLANQVLELVRLTGKEDRYPAQLSGGERQRVALARSLVLEPRILLLDEPLAALDPALRKQMRMELKQLQRQVGITFLFVTHDTEEALSMSDQIAVMNQGRVEQVATPHEVYFRPASRFVAGFLGAMNWINGIGIRPEATRLARIGSPLKGERSCPARVTGTVFLGNCVHVQTGLDTGESAVVEMPRANGEWPEGAPVEVRWYACDEMAFS